MNDLSEVSDAENSGSRMGKKTEGFKSPGRDPRALFMLIQKDEKISQVSMKFFLRCIFQDYLCKFTAGKL